MVGDNLPTSAKGITYSRGWSLYLTVVILVTEFVILSNQINVLWHSLIPYVSL